MAPPDSTQEQIARTQRRLRLGLALNDPPVERAVDRGAFEEADADGRWLLLIGTLVTVCSLVAVWGSRRQAPAQAPANLRPVTATFTPRLAPPEPVAVPGAASRVASYRPITPELSFSAPAPRSAPAAIRAAPAVAPAIPAPDYGARDRRITELKQEAEALDDFVRQIRNNPYVNHYAEPGNYVYEHWRYHRGNWLIQERFDSLMKQLDQRRNEVRREKWRLEGR